MFVSLTSLVLIVSLQTILVRLHDGTIWQSSNEGYTWTEPKPGERFLMFYLHSFSNDRAYLITTSKRHYYTTDTGRTWNDFVTPNEPNNFGASILHFHPLNSELLLWTGNSECSGSGMMGGPNCHAEALYSSNNGRTWTSIESYVRNCAWARDKELKIDSTQIICESFKEKKGNQHTAQPAENPLQLVSGKQYFKQKRKLFDRVVGFAKFSEFLIVAEVIFFTRAPLRACGTERSHYSS